MNTVKAQYFTLLNFFISLFFVLLFYFIKSFLYYTNSNFFFWEIFLSFLKFPSNVNIRCNFEKTQILSFVNVKLDISLSFHIQETAAIKCIYESYFCIYLVTWNYLLTVDWLQISKISCVTQKLGYGVREIHYVRSCCKFSIIIYAMVTKTVVTTNNPFPLVFNLNKFF